jgi:uncharacterized protein (DUF697 family)
VAAAASDLLKLVNAGAKTHAVRADARKPFRFFLCGDPGLVSEMRALLLRGHEATGVPLDAASTLETIDPRRAPIVTGNDARVVLFLGRPGDAAGVPFDVLAALKLPIFVITIDATAGASLPPQPVSAPPAGEVAYYTVAAIDREALRGRIFPHIIDRCKGHEVAVGRRLPVLRETVSAKLTRDAASSALKLAAASAVVENVPLLGIVLGAVASAGDMVAITGVQIALVMQIGATYGHEPDVGHIWELLPVVGGGLGWRALSRELAGFVPVAGIAIKGAIAYAGTIVVGEGASFFYEHGRHMTAAQATVLYDERKRAAMTFARDFIARLRSKKS